MTYRKELNSQFLHLLLLLLLYQTAYLKIGKHAQLCFGIKQLISLPYMIVGHQNLPRIHLEREQQESTSISAQLNVISSMRII